MTLREKRLAFFEMLSSVCWFFMDAAWMMGLGTAAKAAAAPTLIAGLAVFLFTERSASGRLVTAAMNAWALMNVCWMLHDLKTLSWGLAAARAIFCLGAACLIIAFFTARSRREIGETLIRRFRLQRITRR